MIGVYELKKARRLARHFWIVTGGDANKARQMLVAEPSLVGHSPLTTEQMIVLASRLWTYWGKLGVDVPSDMPSESEPREVGE